MHGFLFAVLFLNPTTARTTTHSRKFNIIWKGQMLCHTEQTLDCTARVKAEMEDVFDADRFDGRWMWL